MFQMGYVKQTLLGEFLMVTVLVSLYLCPFLPCSMSLRQPQMHPITQAPLLTGFYLGLDNGRQNEKLRAGQRERVVCFPPPSPALVPHFFTPTAFY